MKTSYFQFILLITLAVNLPERGLAQEHMSLPALLERVETTYPDIVKYEASAKAAQASKWKGSYDGGTPGTCEMEFSRKANGTLSGQIVIHPEGGERSAPATFDSVKLEGNRLTASFSDPDGSPIQVEGKLESKQLKGTWKTANNEGGSWQTTKSQ